MYPTKEQIITSLPNIKISESTIRLLQVWKREHWDTIPSSNKIAIARKEWNDNRYWLGIYDEKDKPETKQKREQNNIKMLLDILGIMLKVQINKVEFNNTRKSLCIPETQTIIIGKPLSIISTLHEFAHLLLGIDETKACAWSIKLFKEAFPEEFSQLKWNGHQLIKQKKYERNNTIFNSK